MIRATLLVTLFSLLVACGANKAKVDLHYNPTTTVRPAKQNTTVNVGKFVDSRGETKTWIGTIRGGMGNHLKELDTINPVSTVVEQAFKDGLTARGVDVNATNPPFQISGTIKTLIGDQVVRREATVAIDIAVIDNSNGEPRFTRSYTANIIEGSALSMSTGIFASLEDLHAIIQKALVEAVDKALDDNDLRAALQI